MFESKVLLWQNAKRKDVSDWHFKDYTYFLIYLPIIWTYSDFHIQRICHDNVVFIEY